MANEIKAKHSTAAALSISLNDLASSTTGVGQAALLVNNANTYQIIHVYVKITTHATNAVTANTQATVYFLKADAGTSPTHLTDAGTWGGTDEGWTAVNARSIGAVRVTATTANVAYYGEFTVYNPGPGWSIGIVQNSGQPLHTTAGNHYVRWVGENPEVQ